MHIPCSASLTEIDGAFLIKRSFFEDKRGFFSTLYQSDWLKTPQIQFNVSLSKKRVFRGFHYSVGEPEGKFISCISGRVLDFLFDVREDSPTYKEIMCVELCEGSTTVYVPPGCAHGFYAVEKSLIGYAATKLWNPVEERGCSVESRDIAWYVKKALSPYIPGLDALHDLDNAPFMHLLLMSDKDRSLPAFGEGSCFEA